MTTNPPPLPPPPRPRRLLAIDPGQRRTGVALSDDLGFYAHPRPALTLAGAALAGAVAALVAAEGVDEVVVGLPLSLSGADSAQTVAARALVRQLRALVTVPVTEWDERLSSVEAGRRVRGAANRKSGALDSESAAVILQAVIDSRRGSGRQ